MQITRPEWRDAIRLPGGPLTMNARHVALTMADYWPKNNHADLWCPVEIIAGHAAMSHRTVNRSLIELREKGFLRLTMAASHGLAARYQPRIPSEVKAQVEAHKRQVGVSTDAKLTLVQAPGWRATPNATPYVNPDSKTSALAPGAAPTSSAPAKITPRPSAENDRDLWIGLMTERGYNDDHDEIYDHWATKYRTPGAFALDMDRKGILDGFLGSKGVDLGLWDEDELDDDDCLAPTQRETS